MRGGAPRRQQMAYLDAQPRSSQQDIEGMFAFLLACVADGGVPGRDVSGITTFVSNVYEGHSVVISEAQLPAFQECTLEVQVLTGFVPPEPTIR